MGVLDTLENIVLSIIGNVAGKTARKMDRKSRQKGLSEEQKQKFLDAKTQAESLVETAEGLKKS